MTNQEIQTNPIHKQLTHLPSHQGKITRGRIAEPGEIITCPACRKSYVFNQERAELMGRQAIRSAHGNPPAGYVSNGDIVSASIKHSWLSARAAATHAMRFIDYRL